MKATLIAALAALALALLAFASPASSRPGRTVRASWYGPGFYGRGLACGGRLHTWTIGVASRSLRCGSRLTVCYRGRCVATRVVDYGPASWTGRELDLTGGLAVKLRYSGAAPVYCSAC